MVQTGTDSPALARDLLQAAAPTRFRWKHILCEMFFGARGISKMSHIWLTLSVLLMAEAATDLRTSLSRSFPLILAVLCRIQFSILANDLSDRAMDSAAGKRRWIAELPRTTGALILAVLLILGLGAVVVWGGSWHTTLAYIASALLAAAYSQKPFRFKERGRLGLIVYALSSVVIYVLVPWMWFRGNPWTLLILAAAAGSDKWVQIHFHQIIDHAADLKAGARTYAVEAGLEQARRTLKMAAITASLCMGIAVAYIAAVADHAVVSGAMLAALIAGISLSRIYVLRIKRQAAHSSDLLNELPWFYLGLTFLVFYALPVLLFMVSAWREAGIWILAVLAVLLLVLTAKQSHRYQYR